MGRDVEESEWERYLELGLTGYVKYGYHMITDYMPDELMLVSGAMNPLVMTGTMVEAQVNGRWDELDYLLIKNNRAYSHGYTEGFWDFTLGNLEGLVTKPVDDVYRMSSYVGDVFSGRNTDNWLMTGVKLISMPMQFVSGIPIYDSLDRMDEDIEKAKSVFRVGRQIMQMSPAEKAELALSAGVALPWTGRAVYNHYNAVFHSEERVAQLFYNGGYGVGAVTGIAADVIVGNAVAKEMMQIGGEIGGKLRGIQNVEHGTPQLSGRWENVNESMSDFSRAYQKQITGQEGTAWVQNGVKFDGMRDGVLLDAKGKYAQFINPNTGEFYDWFSGKESLISEARRQIGASEGAKIQWYFAEEETLNVVQDLFMDNGITEIELIFEAPK